MSENPRKLHLNAFLMSVGHHEASWRLPESDPYAGWSVEHYRNLARIAERGKLDSLFLADSPVQQGDPGRRPAGKLEPTVLLTALAGVTEHIGLIGTASTSYNEPYNLARRLASLDHVSGGRAGWNIVTTAGADAARNFGLDDVPPHADRYERAAEFVEVATKLWDSWDDDAVVADKEAGVHADAAKVRPIGHRGRVLPRRRAAERAAVAAGVPAAGAGRLLRGRQAVRRALGRGGLHRAADPGRAHRPSTRDLKRRAAALGRDPDGIKILPGIVPVIGDTEAEARELDAELERLIGPEYALAQLAARSQARPGGARPGRAAAGRPAGARTRSRAPRAGTP